MTEDKKTDVDAVEGEEVLVDTEEIPEPTEAPDELEDDVYEEEEDEILDIVEKVYVPGDKIPNAEIDPIIAAGNGLFVWKRNMLCDALVLLGDTERLPHIEESANYYGPKIPMALVQKALDFFQAVYKKHSAEAAVLLTLDNDRKWGLEVPNQAVSGASVHYRVDMEQHKVPIAGTIHSHCNMGSFFSGTDDHDDEALDGVHIVIGKLESMPRNLIIIITKRLKMLVTLMCQHL